MKPATQDDSFFSPALLTALRDHYPEVLPGLKVDPQLAIDFPHVETPEALQFVCDVFQKVHPTLQALLAQRKKDRIWIDQKVSQLRKINQDRAFLSADYQMILGRQDAEGRIVVGPLPRKGSFHPVHVPDFLQGDHVTLFGPPDTKKMSINAMNAWHRRIPNEPPLVETLLKNSTQFPKWGADSEDSKTPIMRDLLAANDHLKSCLDGTIQFQETDARSYSLAKEKRAQPIKRFPGLALPDGNHLFNGQPLPLHIVDFAIHFFHNWNNPKALCFYVPKLENEEEALYIKQLLTVAEAIIQRRHPEYESGTIKVILVFESPRSIFRISEMAEALYPHFVGGSLGWHDFLASTARLLRNDPNYRIPVKADPDIVIKNIKESHLILARELGALGALKLGGMYGVLYESGNRKSLDLCLAGFVKDVVTQLRRGLDGFWVAHPDFVRIGFALIEAWRQEKLPELVSQLILDAEEKKAVLSFLQADDPPGLDPQSPLYLRGVIAADVGESGVMSNSDPSEVRYNIFQTLQYLADWLRGNGCVALPAITKSASGEEVFIRVMDDLATTERSRWEVWAEIHHGRVSRQQFETILNEEIAFIQAGMDQTTKKIQVPWEDRWYPIAIRILRQLMTDSDPVEFVSELLMPYSLRLVREQKIDVSVVVRASQYTSRSRPNSHRE